MRMPLSAPVRAVRLRSFVSNADVFVEGVGSRVVAKEMVERRIGTYAAVGLVPSRGFGSLTEAEGWVGGRVLRTGPFLGGGISCEGGPLRLSH